MPGNKGVLMGFFGLEFNLFNEGLIHCQSAFIPLIQLKGCVLSCTSTAVRIMMLFPTYLPCERPVVFLHQASTYPPQDNLRFDGKSTSTYIRTCGVTVCAYVRRSGITVCACVHTYAPTVTPDPVVIMWRMN